MNDEDDTDFLAHLTGGSSRTSASSSGAPALAATELKATAVLINDDGWDDEIVAELERAVFGEDAAEHLCFPDEVNDACELEIEFDAEELFGIVSSDDEGDAIADVVPHESAASLPIWARCSGPCDHRHPPIP